MTQPLHQHAIEYNSEQLVKAVVNNDIEKVKKLVNISDLSHNHYEPLFWAMYYNHQECIEILFEGSDCHDVLKQIHMMDDPEQIRSREYLSFLQANQVKKNLHQHLTGEDLKNKIKKKM